MDKVEGGENGLGWLVEWIRWKGVRMDWAGWMEDEEVRHGLGLLNGWKWVGVENGLSWLDGWRLEGEGECIGR